MLPWATVFAGFASNCLITARVRRHAVVSCPVNNYRKTCSPDEAIAESGA